MRIGHFSLGDGEGAVRALRALAPLVQERVKTLTEADQYVDFLYLDEPPVDEAAWDKAVVRGKAAPEMLDATIAGLEALDEGGWTAAAIRKVVEEATVALGLVNAEGRPQLAKTQGPVRVATTGRAVGPPLFEALEVLGRDATLARLRAARSKLDRS
jgi:glutamyl-tRNA synthetase